MNKCGYITLLSSVDYLPAVLALGVSLQQVQSQYPFIIAVTDNIYDNVNPVLKNCPYIIEKVPCLSYSPATYEWIAKNEQYDSVKNTASKITLFNLTQYDKLVYIDADCLVIQNIDDLFSRPDGSMIKYDNDPWGFTGLMVFEPKMHNYQLYKYIIETCLGFDGNLIGSLWFPCKSNYAYQIPPTYLWHYDFKDDNNSTTSFVKVIHFCNHPKPWIEVSQYYNAEIHPMLCNYLWIIKKVKEKYRL